MGWARSTYCASCSSGCSLLARRCGLALLSSNARFEISCCKMSGRWWRQAASVRWSTRCLHSPRPAKRTLAWKAASTWARSSSRQFDRLHRQPAGARLLSQTVALGIMPGVMTTPYLSSCGTFLPKCLSGHRQRSGRKLRRQLSGCPGPYGNGVVGLELARGLAMMSGAARQGNPKRTRM